MRLNSMTLLWTLLATALVVAGCTKSDSEPQSDDSVAIVVESTTINIGCDEGDYSFTYAIRNGIESLKVAANSNDEWITIEQITANEVHFKAQTNLLDQERSATITLNYPYIENSVDITIVQEAGNPLFVIEVSDLTGTGCITSVTPQNKEMAYIVYMSEVNYLYNAGISTAEQLFEDDYNYFKKFADQYESVLGQFLLFNDIAFIGDSRIGWTGLTPGVDYVVYAYGISFSDDMKDYSLATPIYHKIVTPPFPEFKEVEFDVNIEVDGPMVSYEFAPVDWDGYYSFDIYSSSEAGYIPEGTEVNDELTHRIASNWLTALNMYISSGFSPNELVNILCFKGADAYSEMREADTKYVMVFYAVDFVDDIPVVVSKPQIFHFQTERVEQSSMTFDVQISNLYVRVADIHITPTTNDPYTVAIIRKDLLPEGSDEEIIEWLTTNFSLSMFRGEMKSHINTLDPETEYVALLFGYYGKTVTTPLFRTEFATDAAGECENRVLEVRFNGPYSPQELADAMPDLYGHVAMYEQYGFYLFWSEIITEQPTTDIFHHHYEPSDFETMSINEIIEDLTYYNYEPTQVLVARSGIEFVMCGLTMDYRGNYSDLWISEPFSYEYTPQTKRPIEELLEKIDGTRSGKLMLVNLDQEGKAQRSRVSDTMPVFNSMEDKR